MQAHGQFARQQHFTLPYQNRHISTGSCGRVKTVVGVKSSRVYSTIVVKYSTDYNL